MAKLSTAQLREELRNARRSANNQQSTDTEHGLPNTAGGNIDGVRKKYYRPERSIPENIPGHSPENYFRNGNDNSIERSPDEESIRKRSADRRSSSSNSGEFSSSESTTSTTGDTGRTIRRKGRLIADDPIPERQEYSEDYINASPLSEEEKGKLKQARGRPRKEKTEVVNVQPRKAVTEAREDVREEGKFSFPKFFKEGNKLSVTEAAMLEEPFIAGMEAYFQYFDEYIRYATHDTTNVVIWSDLDKEDCTALAQVLLKWGQHNELVASGVRVAVNTGDYITVLTLLVPRTIKTVDQFKRAPKIHKPGYFERKRMVREQGNQV